MSEKYIDLAPTISRDWGYMSSEARSALSWLDDHPDQVPGRTITESQIAEAFGDEYHYWAKRRLSRIGITVVPDPEPTPQQRLEALIFEEWGDRDDAQDITHAILKEFDVSVKASGANDEH